MTFEACAASTSSLGLAKMEDRKRSAATDPDDPLPSLKRQATGVNGIKPEDTAEWDPLLQDYQKDALLRNYKLQKKEKEEVEARLSDLVDRCRYHDDHIRAIDAWLHQFLDELRVYGNDLDQLREHDSNLPLSSLSLADPQHFESHLSAYADDFKLALSGLLRKTPLAPPEVERLQQELSDALAKGHGHQAELEGLRQEKTQLDEQLMESTWRYMKAEKKIERDKSKVYNKVFQNDGRSAAVEVKVEARDTNGTLDSPVMDPNMEVERQMALAAADKRKAQVAELEETNRKLTEQVTTLNIRLAGLSDDDYAKTDLFKEMKSRYEDVVKRINHLEATNVELREEAQKLQAERTAHRMQVDEQSRTIVAEAESELAKTESDLTRVREQRDEYVSKLKIAEETLGTRQSTLNQLKELCAASDSRVKALESELERLKIRLGEVGLDTPDNVAAMSEDELRAKVTSLSRENQLIGSELPGMESAWRKAQALARKNVEEILDIEKQLAKLSSEKEKAFQKFYALAKTREVLTQENSALRAQNAKSSGIVTQLKEAEGAAKLGLTQMEKALAEAKEMYTSTSQQLRDLQQKVTTYTISAENLTAQTLEYKKQLISKDSELSDVARNRREREVEIEQLKTKLEQAQKATNDWKAKAAGKATDSEEMLRRIAYCSVCKANLKDTLIKRCNHIHCNDCIQRRIKDRDRRCPHCNLPFGSGDVTKVALNL